MRNRIISVDIFRKATILFGLGGALLLLGHLWDFISMELSSLLYGPSVVAF